MSTSDNTPKADGIWADMAAIRVWENVDKARFDSEIAPAGEPALIKGAAAHWPLIEKAAQSDEALCAALREAANNEPVQAFFAPPEVQGRFFYDETLSGYNFERRMVPLRNILDDLLRLRTAENSPALYAGGVPIPKVMPDLLKGLDLPLLDPSVDKLTSAWIGNHTRIPAHWDLPQNLACVIKGTRRFTLFPPDQLDNLYSGPLDFTLAGQPVSLVDFHAPDDERFPRFGEALAHARYAILEPGDVLYVPSMWWHHVESFSSLGMMINFWWREGPDYMFTPLHTLYHALLSIRDLPPQERETWKLFFDHYIFQANGEPMAHMPEDQRGILGPMTPERAARVRAFLAQILSGRPS